MDLNQDKKPMEDQNKDQDQNPVYHDIKTGEQQDQGKHGEDEEEAGGGS